MSRRILVIGAYGQIGTELTMSLRAAYSPENIIASDIIEGDHSLAKEGPFHILDAMNGADIEALVKKYQVSDIYLMAAMLSAQAEKFPKRAWDLNMNSLFNVLNLAKEGKIETVFWPSSIAVFGPSTPKVNTPQRTIMEPTTVYGISKQTGERWCEYYHRNHGVDIRSLRYPGLISYKASPGGGTTDYAVDIYHKALEDRKFTSFLKADTSLPMMYMEDAIDATLAIMNAPKENIKIRSSYNLAAVSFSPEEMATSIREHIPEFQIDYAPDYRQKIADSWPQSIDDGEARKDWGWQHRYGLEDITRMMLENLKQKQD